MRSALISLLIVTVCAVPGYPQSAEQININTAPVEELMRLPQVGQTVARRIIEFRIKHGAFKRPQEIIVIKGMNARRYRLIAPLIRI